jgi:hypothetical protein
MALKFHDLKARYQNVVLYLKYEKIGLLTKLVF